jgi:hypothetical protein
MSASPLTKTLLLALGLWGAQRVLLARRRRQHVMRRQKNEAVRTWEGEGGAVPVSSNRTAAAVTPAPLAPRDGQTAG